MSNGALFPRLQVSICFALYQALFHASLFTSKILFPRKKRLKEKSKIKLVSSPEVGDDSSMRLENTAMDSDNHEDGQRCVKPKYGFEYFLFSVASCSWTFVSGAESGSMISL